MSEELLKRDRLPVFMHRARRENTRRSWSTTRSGPFSIKRAIIVAVIDLVMPPRCQRSPISSGTPLPFFRSPSTAEATTFPSTVTIAARPTRFFSRRRSVIKLRERRGRPAVADVRTTDRGDGITLPTRNIRDDKHSAKDSNEQRLPKNAWVCDALEIRLRAIARRWFHRRDLRAASATLGVAAQGPDARRVGSGSTRIHRARAKTARMARGARVIGQNPE